MDTPSTCYWTDGMIDEYSLEYYLQFMRCFDGFDIFTAHIWYINSLLVVMRFDPYTLFTYFLGNAMNEIITS